jgi:hypothetical protein
MASLTSALKNDIILEPDLYSDIKNPHEITLENYSDRLKNPLISPFQNNEKKMGKDSNENDYPEIDVIEIPVVKRVVFQFNKPVELNFS